MFLQHYTVGSNRSNCYILVCEKTKDCTIIDPGFDRIVEAEMILEYIRENVLNVKYIINTHGHADHVVGNGIIKKETGATILIHEFDSLKLVNIPERWLKRVELNLTCPPPADKYLKEDDIVRVGNLNLRIIHTPGHSKGSISILCKDILFTGDCLFEGAVGRTDIPDSSFNELIASITNKIMKLPEHIKIYPGHGDFSTIGEEKKNNPFLRKYLGKESVSSLLKNEFILSSLSLSKVMTPIDLELETCKEYENVKAIKAKLKIHGEGVKIIAVIDDFMRLVGTIRPTDLLRARSNEEIINSIMDKNTRAISLDEKINIVWEYLQYHRFIPVTDKEYHIKGFVHRKKFLNFLWTIERKRL